MQSDVLKEEASPSLLNRVETLKPFVGNTPLFPLSHISPKPGVKIMAKLEWQQMGGSVKARPAFEMIKSAIENNTLDADKRLLDASSGNTGIAYATFARSLGLDLTLCLPENASKERKMLLQALGANLLYTSPFGSTDEAQEKAVELKNNQPETYYYADQYANDANWQAHYRHTGAEIMDQTNGQVTHFTAGLGTTGTFTGTGRYLKEVDNGVKLVSLQPDAAMHGLEGWKHLPTAKVPAFYDSKVADDNFYISSEEAFEWVKMAADKEGLLISPSSAANLAGAYKIAENINEGVVVTIFPDNLEKYGEVIETIFNQ